MDNQPIYDTRAAARILGTTQSGLRKHITAGHVQAGRLGRKYLISQAEIDRLSGLVVATVAAQDKATGAQ